MQNDSIETLLLRHYGSSAQVPDDLERQLCSSVRHEAAKLRERERIATNLRQRRFSRRQVIRFVVTGGVGMGALSVGIDGLHMLEAALTGQGSNQAAYS